MRRHVTLPTLTALLYLATFSAAGCNNATDGVSAAPDAEPATPTITVETRSWEELQQVVGEHAGKIVVVDLWTSW